MPLTPFHLGPGLLLGVLTLRFFNFWPILLGSVVMDIEPLILATRNFVEGCPGCPDHSFFHSIFGAIVGSLILATILWKFKVKLNQISLKLKISQPYSFKVLFSSSLIAWLIHIFFDSLTNFDVFLFWPIKYNPILIGPKVFWSLNFLLLIFGIIGLILFFKKYARH